MRAASLARYAAGLPALQRRRDHPAARRARTYRQVLCRAADSVVVVVVVQRFVCEPCLPRRTAPQCVTVRAVPEDPEVPAVVPGGAVTVTCSLVDPVLPKASVTVNVTV
jgi:predicted component of type VI protein secretion system